MQVILNCKLFYSLFIIHFIYLRLNFMCLAQHKYQLLQHKVELKLCFLHVDVHLLQQFLLEILPLAN